MAELPMTLDDRTRDRLQAMAGEGIHLAAEGLSRMLGQPITVSDPVVRLVPLLEIPQLLGGPENEAVAIYLQAEGALAGQMMLVLPQARAAEFVDLLLGQPPGSTFQLDSLERSALAEVGNLAGSFFLNAIAALTGLGTRPSPPAVMVDMVGAILDVVVATAGADGDYVMLLQAAFRRGEQEVQADFWMIPEPEALRAVLGGVWPNAA